MYYQDLTPYTYDVDWVQPFEKDLSTLNVGWLQRGFSFPLKLPSDELLDGLFFVCQYAVHETRGYHICNICDHVMHENEMFEGLWLPPPMTALRKGRQLTMGMAEIRIVSRIGRRYAAPTLIYHYVDVHHYAPPVDFVEAVIDQYNTENQT